MKIKSLFPLVLVSLLATPVMADEQETLPSASQTGQWTEAPKQFQERRELMAQNKEQRRARIQEQRMNRYQEKPMNRYRVNQYHQARR